MSSPLEVDDDADSAIGMPADTASTRSIRSSILEYQHENGRRYHTVSAGKYMYPNDDLENERLDLQDFVFFLSLGGRRVICPYAEQARRVLDIGTGTGVWAIEFGEEHPAAEVIGVDLSPIQPSYIPPNVFFQIYDLDNEWTFTRNFDFVFSRMMTGSFDDPLSIMRKVYDNLEPGGYYELQDLLMPIKCDDGTLDPNGALARWCEDLMLASSKQGRSLGRPDLYPDLLRQAGFVDVVEKVYKWPTNTWPKHPQHKETGRWNLESVDQGVEAMTLALYTRCLGWSVEDTLALCDDVRVELRNPHIHAYWDILVHHCRKPLMPDEPR